MGKQCQQPIDAARLHWGINLRRIASLSQEPRGFDSLHWKETPNMPLPFMPNFKHLGGSYGGGPSFQPLKAVTQLPCFRNSDTTPCCSRSGLLLFRVSAIVSTHIDVDMGAITEPSRCGADCDPRSNRGPGDDFNHTTFLTICYADLIFIVVS